MLSEGLFNASDSDVTFVSSDKRLFHVHRKNLETNAAGFPPAEIDTLGEVVPLTEDSATLDLLFSFIYPRRHPDLGTTPFDILAPLAEAAEKYEVFSAMNICKIRMGNFLPYHPAEILSYAVKHDYPVLANRAAPLNLDTPLTKMVTAIPLNLVIPWVRYYETWSGVVLDVLISTTPSGPRSDKNCSQCCREYDGVLRRILSSLRGKKSFAALEEQISVGFGGSQHLAAGYGGPLHIDAGALISYLKKQLEAVPKFSLLVKLVPLQVSYQIQFNRLDLVQRGDMVGIIDVCKT